MAGEAVLQGAGGHVQPSAMDGYALPTYAYRAPPEIGSSEPGRHKIVIVGGGLTGLTLALDLGLRGIPVVVLDEDNSVGASGLSSRGVVYVHRTLEIFDRLGIADKVLARGVGWDVGRVYKGESEIYAFRSQPPGRGRLPANINIQQFFVEEYLVDRIAEVLAVDLRWCSRVTGVEQGDREVTLVVATPDGEYRIKADWVVACDGGNSFIRSTLDVPTNTHLFDDVWCIADIRTDSPAAAERRLWLDAAFNDGGVVLNHAMADGVVRYNCQIAHYADQEHAGSQAEIRRRLNGALGEGASYELVWTGVWRYKRRLTEQFVCNRVIFAGDSAHQVPPFGARGGNSGVADADNLAWKLAMVVGDAASPALLDTYGEERHAAACENVAVTSRSALFLSPDTAGRRLFRDAVLALAHVLPSVRPMVNTGRIAAAQHYPTSSLNLGGAWDRAAGAAGPAEGSPGLDGPVERPDGTRTYLSRMAAGEMTVLWFLPEGEADLPAGAAACWEDAAEAGMPLRRIAIVRVRGAALPVETVIDGDGGLFTAFGAEAGATYVLRPDGYVLFRDARIVLPPVWPMLLRRRACAA
jgi:3-(3-hydroxy-phenyl)propionate hydroxylase